jgi:predicted enzyme related to lactoylglutathione lyase
MSGSFVWYDLMTTDMAAATTFYRTAIGWTAADSGMPGPAYTLLSAGDTMIGGLMEIPAEVRAAGGRPGWMGYIGVDDVDAMVERVTKAGGHLHKPAADIPGVGRFAVVADPHGATFYLFKGQTTGEAAKPGGMMPGHVGWNELQAGDGPAAFDFYASLFGWTKDHDMDMGPMGVYRIFSIDGVQAGGMMTKQPQVPAPHWLFYFAVAATDAAIERIKGAGGSVLNGPMEVPGGAWVAQCIDPQGAVFAVVGPQR